ncbi:uncharacterized protein [Dysidea avara]|uniref:uncharacterized protein n=1 Tax=Dysidea avara TaxID=196820 RepID=UPI00332F4BC5
MSSCVFINNRIGRNMIRFMFSIVGAPSQVVIDNCIFENNSNHSLTLVEVTTSIYSQIVTKFVNSSFTGNRHSALLYIHLSYSDVVTMNGIDIKNNTGYFLEKKGGFIFLKISEALNCSVNLTELNYIGNHFTGNIRGGGIYLSGAFNSGFKCRISNSSFYSNSGSGSGAVIYTSLTSVSVAPSCHGYVFFIDNCDFNNNTGKSIVYMAMNYYVIPAFLILNGNFINNTGIPLELVNIILVGKGNTTIQNNQAQTGAALHLSGSYILFNYSSFQLNIINNHAKLFGGGIYMDFSLSRVDNYGTYQCHWLLFSQENFCQDFKHIYNNCTTRICALTFCSMLERSSGPVVSVLRLINNTALLSGSAIFYDSVANVKLYNRSMSNPTSIFYIPKILTIFPNCTCPLILATHPEKLQLSDPAKCDDNFTSCSITDIMLGQEIKAPASVLGYNNKPAQGMVFSIKCDKCNNYALSNQSLVLVKDMLHGISITGTQVSKNETSLSLKLDSGSVSLLLTIVIVPCHLGYVYTKDSEKCECYITPESIVKCKSKQTTIKKDYWFGSVEGNYTSVSRCPNKYCNFTRQEVSPGRFLLPPTYDDQCGLRRTGPACGRCSNEYTLSYEFDYCIDIKDCTPGITLLVVVCTVLYWIIVVVVVLGVMYFQINMGYLYGIVYYYSVLDILLGDIWNYCDELIIFNKIIFSIVRMNPAFLGKLCFAKGMSGIDQNVLYYIHPTAIALILVVLVVFARRSRRFATFISKGIIRAICLFLTLAYTSIANTSLLLLRPLRFIGVSRLYCYLSPEIRYFTGRHIAYGTIAVLYELVIVSGLPLLLLLEPFVNHKINFTRIKPLLDQFQGCYKDKCRWFASVYLLCRQVILIIVVLNYLDNYIALYVLMAFCVIIVFLHYIIQPYKIDTLNKFDALFLLLLVMLVCLQVIVLSEYSFTNDAVIGVAYTLIFSPLFVCIVSLLYLQRKLLQHLVKCLMYKILIHPRKWLHFTSDIHSKPPLPLSNCPLCGRSNARQVDDCPPSDEYLFQESLLNYID